MVTTTSKKGIWDLNDTYKKIAADFWFYDNNFDPGAQSLHVWGSNEFGKLGTGDVIPTSSPVQIPGSPFSQWNVVRAGTFSSFGIKTDNTLWSWGRNYLGVLGDSGFVHRSSPSQIPGTQWCDVRADSWVVHGLKTDGTLWHWGYNFNGAGGVGTTIGYCSFSPRQVPGNQWVAVTNHTSAGHAIKTDGTLWGWGQGNFFGVIGNGTNSASGSPAQIPGNTWVQVNNSGRSSKALKSDGTLWTWGYSAQGVNGDGTITCHNSPVQIPGNQWSTVSSAPLHVLALKTDNTLWGWGNGVSFNPACSVCFSSPVQIPGTQWCAIDAGIANNGALKTNGTLWSWGGINSSSNTYGSIGDNTNVHRSSPTQIPGTWARVSSSPCSCQYKLAIKVLT